MELRSPDKRLERCYQTGLGELLLRRYIVGGEEKVTIRARFNLSSPHAAVI